MPKSLDAGSCRTMMDLLTRMKTCCDSQGQVCRALPLMPTKALNRFSGGIIPDDIMGRMLPAVGIACGCARQNPGCGVPGDLAMLILRNFGVLKNI